MKKFRISICDPKLIRISEAAWKSAGFNDWRDFNCCINISNEDLIRLEEAAGKREDMKIERAIRSALIKLVEDHESKGE